MIGYTIFSEFLEEKPLLPSPAGGPATVVSITLISYDPPSNLVLKQGYWGGTAGGLVEARAALDATNRVARGSILMPRETGVRRSRRYEMRHAGKDRFEARTFAKRPDGSEYINEELIYERVS